jgi:large subunit ribosomal protein L17
MRHQMANRKLGRTSAHRSALFRNQISSMIQHERIVTTLIKAKELRPLVEKMVTLGKDDSVHARRQAARTLTDRDVVQKLFSDISARFNERPGGYTRIVKLGPRRGDGAEMAILEFVDYQLERPVEPIGKQAKAPAAKKAKSDEKAEPEAEEKPKKTRKKKTDAEAE